MKHAKILRRLLQFFYGIVAAYFLIYATLSLGGSYQVIEADLNHADYGWVPCGFYPPKHQDANWVNYILIRIYPQLWKWDDKFIHKNPPPSYYRNYQTEGSK